MSVTYHTKTVAKVGCSIARSVPPMRRSSSSSMAFPTAGHMFRDLNPRLSDRYHVITPDLPGFGNKKAPLRKESDHTVDNPARVIDAFIEAFGFSRYALYVFDYGAPRGATASRARDRDRQPERRCLTRRAQRYLLRQPSTRPPDGGTTSHGKETVMRAKPTTHPTKKLILVAALSLLAPAMAQADPPGYDFMMFPERMALVVDASGKAPKATISEEAAKAITAGAQPVDGASVILLYQGKLYIVPDKRLGNGKMASDMVKSSVPSAGK
jgi:pimeloyl-ACP methyl ester carboxylesterase